MHDIDHANTELRLFVELLGSTYVRRGAGRRIKRTTYAEPGFHHIGLPVRLSPSEVMC